MKKLVLVFLTLTACAVLPGVPPVYLGYYQTYQLKSGCNPILIDKNTEVSSQTNTDLTLTQIDGVTWETRVNNNFKTMCAVVSARAIPDKYALDIMGTINGGKVQGNTSILILPPNGAKLVTFIVKSGSQSAGYSTNLTMSQNTELCLGVFARATTTDQLLPVKTASQINLLAFPKTGIAVVTRDSNTPLCFQAPAGILKGQYLIPFKGRVKNIGFAHSFNITVN
jgi:hypothetical protein